MELTDLCRDRAMCFVVERGLTNVKVSGTAAVALTDVCHACSARLNDQFDSLASQCLHTLKLPHRDSEVAINVLKGDTCSLLNADVLMGRSVDLSLTFLTGR